MSFWDAIVQGDKDLFKLINISGSAEGLDGFMMLMRHQYTWIPLYAFMLYYIVRYARRQAIQFIALTMVCFAITDFTSASIIKPMVARLRPCHDPELMNIARVLVGCGGENSFPSTHASNHFGLATFWFFAITRMTGRKWYWLWAWALIVCYAQVYVGKHFPLDIAGGALLGFLAGVLCFKIFDRWTSSGHGRTVELRKRTGIEGIS
jgi:undecaprenyl-diphosphatase